ncbi:CMRF35-like molecule 1 [Xyrauchen texanus]|uniref:CMRF35-like molecule 1 n=1 Tax=Xyrauchen texanus TaxID=154827 RepID=UPI0022419022|nr:CMRF35-like molecule 1 [Xyrauchen texanus]
MWSFIVVFICIFSVESLTVTAPVGGMVTLTCSHLLARFNIKYFCRADCADNNILIRSKTGKRETHKGRYTLHDMGTEFTVTITDLRKSDSGTYICAVERFLKDTFSDVTLNVIEGTPEIGKSTAATKPPVTASRSAVSEHLVYFGAGLGALVLILTVLLFILIKQKYKQKRCSSTVTSAVHQSDSVNYATVSFTAQPDSLNYSSVFFIKDPDYDSSEMFSEDATIYSSVRS